jgi:MtN3 and saliva related transmembrane protein
MKPSAGVEIIGWVSSAILLLTIGRQIWKQWQEGSSEGVSVVLFIGQMAASLGFTIYSFLVHNWIFVVTNALMLTSGLIGLGITIYHRKRGSSGESSGESSQA